MKKIIVIFMCIIACTSCSNKEINEIKSELEEWANLNDKINYDMYLAAGDFDLNKIEEITISVITYLNSENGVRNLEELKLKLDNIKERINILEASDEKRRALEYIAFYEYYYEQKMSIRNINTDFSLLTEDEKRDIFTSVHVLISSMKFDIEHGLRGKKSVSLN